MTPEEKAKILKTVAVEAIKQTNMGYLVDNLGTIHDTIDSIITSSSISSETFSVMRLGPDNGKRKAMPHMTIRVLELPEFKNSIRSSYSSTPENALKILTHSSEYTHVYLEFIQNGKLLAQLPPALLESISTLPIESLTSALQERTFVYEKDFSFHYELAKCNTCVNLAIADGIPHIDVGANKIIEYSKTETILENTANREEKKKIIKAISNIKSVLNNKEDDLTSNEKTEILIDVANKDITRGINAKMKYIPKK